MKKKHLKCCGNCSKEGGEEGVSYCGDMYKKVKAWEVCINWEYDNNKRSTRKGRSSQ